MTTTTTTTTTNIDQFDNHVVYTYIDQWEKHSIAKIQLAAQQARDDLKEAFTESNDECLKLLYQLNEQLDATQNFTGKIYTLMQKLNKLRQELSNPSIHLEQDTNVAPIYFIRLSRKRKQQISKKVKSKRNIFRM